MIVMVKIFLGMRLGNHLDSGSKGLVNILKSKRAKSFFCYFCIDILK